MKKSLAASLVLFGIIFLAGCSQQPISQLQPAKLNSETQQLNISPNNISKQDQINDTTKKKVFFKNDSGYAEGNNIVIFLYNKEKTKKVKISFEGDVSKLNLPEEEDVFGNKKEYEYWSFGYDGLSITLDASKRGGSMQDEFKGMTYECNGSLYKTNGNDRPNFFCNTNNKDYLEQYEIFMSGPSAGDASIGFWWDKIYLKKITDIDIFFFGRMASEHDLSNSMSIELPFEGNFTELKSDSKNFPGQYIISKEYLENLIKGENNTNFLKEWDEFVQNLNIQIME